MFNHGELVMTILTMFVKQTGFILSMCKRTPPIGFPRMVIIWQFFPNRLKESYFGSLFSSLPIKVNSFQLYICIFACSIKCWIKVNHSDGPWTIRPAHVVLGLTRTAITTRQPQLLQNPTPEKKKVSFHFKQLFKIK